MVPTRISRVAPSVTSSSHTMPADGHPIPVVWTLIGSPSERAGEAEHAASPR